MEDSRGAGAAMAPEAGQSWHALSPDGAAQEVEGDLRRGLEPAEAARRLLRHGPNALAEPSARSLWRVLGAQFASPLIYLLLGAAAVALLLGERGDALIIAIVVVLNAAVGALQEGRAERSLAALRKLSRHRARVIRGGQVAVIEARDVVPGDLLELEAGDAVAADARLCEGAALQLAEAALTGESAPVAKSLAPVASDTPLADRRNMVYAGTHVTAGRARAIVIATGAATELGHIAALAESAVEPRTPLEQRVAQFGRYVIVAAVGLFAVILAVGLLRGVPLAQLVMIAISQVVGMIPEGLPVAMTIALAVGVQRMARRHTVVRRLAAVEVLGSTTIICTDKTGTLTRNEMTVTTIYLPGSAAPGREAIAAVTVTVSGAGYEPSGTFQVEQQQLDPAGATTGTTTETTTGATTETTTGATADTTAADLRALLEAGVLCNDAELVGPTDASPRWTPVGDPTEVALVAAAVKGGVIPAELRAQQVRRAEIPFDSAVKMMATQHQTARGWRVIVKGAPEEVLELCARVRRGGASHPLSDAGRREVAAAAEQLAQRALRVLAIGVIEGPVIDGPGASAPDLLGPLGLAALRGKVSLLGLFGQIDPPRQEVAEAVARCRAAGIRAVMVTGDHKLTAHAIARQLGIAGPDADEVVDGRELAAMDDAALAARIDRLSVFARVHPAQKLRIVAAYQARGHVVAMTGDGVNDAPALAKADVGVAMGASGTEVAKEAAKIVIGDDNFATIVAAVEEGRVVYRNIKKAVLLLFSTSAAEVLVLLLALILGFAPPLVAVQILWNNLVTEGLVTVNLIMERPEGDEMRAPPIPRAEPLLSRTLLWRMAVMVPAIVACTLGWYVARIAAGVPPAQVRTETFVLLALCEWYNVLNCRSETASALTLGVLRNRWLLAGLIAGNLLQAAVVFWPPLCRVFRTVPLGPVEVVALGVVGSVVLWVEELRKLVVRRRRRRAAG